MYLKSNTYNKNIIVKEIEFDVADKETAEQEVRHALANILRDISLNVRAGQLDEIFKALDNNLTFRLHIDNQKLNQKLILYIREQD